MADADSKVCPDCAEEVRAAAQTCRFCGYSFTAGKSGPASFVARGAPPSASPAPIAPAVLQRNPTVPLILIVLLVLVVVIGFYGYAQRLGPFSASTDAEAAWCLQNPVAVYQAGFILHDLPTAGGWSVLHSVNDFAVTGLGKGADLSSPSVLWTFLLADWKRANYDKDCRTAFASR